jgi:hypothetical protein
MPGLDVNDRASRDCQLHIENLETPDAKEIIPQIKLRVNPQASHRVMKAAICRIPRGSDYIALGHSIAAMSGGIREREYQIPALKRPQRTPHILPQVRRTQGPLARGTP